MINKVDAIIMNWDRPDSIKKTARYLLKHKNINNVIISHCNKNSIFEFGSKDNVYNAHKLIHVNHINENNTYGLACRFLCNKYVTTEAVLILDDDLLFEDKHIKDLLSYYNKHPECITGYFGKRVIKLFGFVIYHPLRNPYLKYSILRLFYRFFTFLYIFLFNIPYNIALTKMIIVPKKALDLFFEKSYLIEDFVKDKAKPLWNGEDIFLNLIYSKETGNCCKVYNPYISIHETKDGSNGISSQSSHKKYRFELATELSKRLKINFDLLGIPNFNLLTYKESHNKFHSNFFLNAIYNFIDNSLNS